MGVVGQKYIHLSSQTHSAYRVMMLILPGHSPELTSALLGSQQRNAPACAKLETLLPTSGHRVSLALSSLSPKADEQLL